MTRAAARLLTRRIVGAGTARVSEDPPSAFFEADGVSIVLGFWQNLNCQDPDV